MKLAVQDKNTTRSRPWWVGPRKQIICNQYCMINSYILAECAIQLADKQNFVDSYEKLFGEQ